VHFIYISLRKLITEFSFLREILCLWELGVYMQPKVTRVAGESYANCSLLREVFAVKYKTFYACLMHRNAVDSFPSIMRFVTIVPEVFPLCL
jgi:hypothetical protein